MSPSVTATMSYTSERRPSEPPSKPLPALPIPKTRRTAPETSDPSASRQGSVSSTIPLTTRPPIRSVTTSGLPAPTYTKSRSTPAVPTLYTTHATYDPPSSPYTGSLSSSIPTPGKTVRKTTSIGAFPLPPKSSARVSSLPPSPLSTSTSLSDIHGLQVQDKRRLSARHRNSESSTKKSKARSSGYGVRSRSSAVGISSSPSFLNGTGDDILISGANSADGLLSLPSPPQSRSSSANGSYVVDGTEIEDAREEMSEDREKSMNADTMANNKRDSGSKDSKGNVLVSVRVRPDTGGEGREADGEWMVDGRRSLISYNGKEAGDYRYDNVFSPHDNNARVYDNAAKRLVRRVMEGYHGTVFAYGMTGTGKTFSMQGTANSPGVIPLAITDIFSYIRENPNREFLLRVSYLEIYNEKIYDLLSQGQQQEEIQLREDSKRGVYATPLKEEIVQSPNQLLRVIARGDLARRTSSTQFNARSSRSHAVVQIVVESRERTPALSTHSEKEGQRVDHIVPGGVLVSTLSLIDLAGSERAAESKERRTEGAHINKSLLTLGTVIARLSGDDDKDDGKKTAIAKEKGSKHLPYRDSKLTRLLQPALSGDSLTSILCTVQLSAAGTSAAAASSHTGETLNTLKFASRAKNNIVSHAKRNETNPNSGDAGSRALLDRYRLEIQDLRTQLEQQNKAKEEAEQLDEIEKDRRLEEELERAERNRHSEQMLEMQLARTALKERISHLNRLILSSKSIGVNSGRLSGGSTTLGRTSVLSNNEYGRPTSSRGRNSISPRASAVTLEALSPTELPSIGRALSSGSITMGVLPTPQMSQLTEDDDANEEEDDVLRGAGDEGDATLVLQNRMLQADLADKNRYISTLEKRLLQARRTSHGRMSMHLASRAVPQEEGDLESVVQEKIRENDELRAKLDDQMRMVTALRSAARKRDALDQRMSSSSMDGARRASTANETGAGGSHLITRPSLRRPPLASSHRSNPSMTSRPSSSVGNFVNFSKTPLSPVVILSSTPSEEQQFREGTDLKTSRRKSVDEMTLLLDQMIQEKVDNGQVVHSERGSLRIKRDTVMERSSLANAASGAESSDYDEPVGELRAW